MTSPPVKEAPNPLDTRRIPIVLAPARQRPALPRAANDFPRLGSSRTFRVRATDSSGLTRQIETKEFETAYIVFDRDLEWICEDEEDDHEHSSDCC